MNQSFSILSDVIHPSHCFWDLEYTLLPFHVHDHWNSWMSVFVRYFRSILRFWRFICTSIVNSWVHKAVLLHFHILWIFFLFPVIFTTDTSFSECITMIAPISNLFWMPATVLRSSKGFKTRIQLYVRSHHTLSGATSDIFLFHCHMNWQQNEDLSYV